MLTSIAARITCRILLADSMCQLSSIFAAGAVKSNPPCHKRQQCAASSAGARSARSAAVKLRGTIRDDLHKSNLERQAWNKTPCQLQVQAANDGSARDHALRRRCMRQCETRDAWEPPETTHLYPPAPAACRHNCACESSGLIPASSCFAPCRPAACVFVPKLATSPNCHFRGAGCIRAKLPRDARCPAPMPPDAASSRNCIPLPNCASARQSHETTTNSARRAECPSGLHPVRGH